MLELKHLLKGLIALLIIIQVGCGTKEVSTNIVEVKFSPKYYIVKPPTEKDEEILKQYSVSNDKKISSEANTLLLGYYIKTKQYKKSDKLLNSDKIFSDEGELKNYLSYWRAESNINNNKKITKKDKNILNLTEAYTLKNKICSKYDLKDKELNCPNRVKEKKMILEDKKDEPIKEEPMIADLNQDSKIYIKDADENIGINQGILYSIKENNLNFEITKEKENDETIMIDSYERTLNYKGNIISFDINYNKDLDLIFNYTWNKNPDLIVIGINERYIGEATQLSEKFKAVALSVIILNYERPDFRNKLDVIKEEYGENQISFIGFGNETGLADFVPYLKLISDNPDDIDIIVIVDVFDDYFFRDEFKGYFNNVVVFSYINANLNFWTKEFFNGFKFFYGDNPDLNAYIGYDMILKLKKSIDNNTKDIYASNIKRFVDNKAYREIEAYQILSYNKLKKIILDE